MSLKVWLPLNGDLRNQGSSDIEFINNNVTFNTSGKIGPCAEFNGSNSYLLSNNFEIGNIWSYGMWIYSETSSRSWEGVLILNNDGGDSDIQLGMYTYPGGNRIQNTANGQYNSNISYTYGQWNHFMGTFDGTNLKTYLNGTLINTKNITASLLLKTYLTIGARHRSSTCDCYFQGKINDLRIYDHCLSAAEVREIAQGLVLHYKLDGNGFGNPNILVNTHFDERYNQTTGWDTTKNGTILASSWGGYNSGVTNANTVYHAHLKLVDDEYVYEYIKTANETWLGISQGGLQNKLIAGEIYTFSWEQYSVSGSNANYGGLYYYKTGATSAGFHLGSFYGDNSPTGQWKKFSYTFTAPSDGDYSKNMSWYVYGTRGGNGVLYTRHLKLEKGNSATPWSPAPTDNLYTVMGLDSNIAEDNSGYGYNGTITGNLQIFSNTTRYNNSAYFDGSSYISTAAGSMAWYQMDKGTLACWMKPTASMTSWRGSWGVCADGTYTTKGWAITDYNNIFYFTWTNNSYYQLLSSGKTLTQNEWHHCAATLDGTTVKLYFDGELVKTETIDWGTATLSTATRMELGVDFPGTDEKFTGYYSDARFYVTPLLDNDIKVLYNTTMRIDPHKNIHNFELNENAPYNKLTPTGMLEDNMVESYLTLSDGSKWKLMLFHYVDGGTNLFTSSNATYCNEWGLYSRLSQITNYQYDGKYEYYVIQDGTEFRWTQTSSPTASSISGLTTVSGYNNPVNGLAKASQNNTYIGYNAWWGACGCWTSYSTGGKTGIPGFGSHDANGICTKYLILYTRVSDFGGTFEDGTAFSNNFIEM